MANASLKDVLAAMDELERELTAARDEARREASAQVSSNDSYRFLLGVSIGLDRALKMVQSKTAVLPPNAPPLP